MVELLSYKGIANSDREDLIDALKIFSQTQLSIVDSILCAKAVNQDMTLFTFDEELAKLFKKKSRHPE